MVSSQDTRFFYKKPLYKQPSITENLETFRTIKKELRSFSQISN